MRINFIVKNSNILKTVCTKAAFFACAAAFVIDASGGSGVLAANEAKEGVSGRGRGAFIKTGAETDDINKYKSGFIGKINRYVKSGAPVSPERYARLKNEIEKMRERIVKRIERIDKKTLDLNSERARIAVILSELETAAADFEKIKIVPAPSPAPAAADNSKLNNK